MDDDTIIVYGWREGNNECIIHSDWLQEYKINKFAYQIFNSYPSEAIYGLRCYINKETGDLILSKDDVKYIEFLHNIVERHNKYYNIITPHLRYFRVQNNDNNNLSWDHFVKYTPMDLEELDELDELEELDEINDVFY
jgi:hypothetical protein